MSLPDDSSVAAIVDSLLNVPSNSDASSISFDSDTVSLRLIGYYSGFDRGWSRYARTASEPSHDGKFRSVDRFLPNGTESATNGGWWELVEEEPNPFMFGAKGDGVTDDTTALQKCWNYAAQKGRGVYLPAATFKITDTITSSVRRISGVADRLDSANPGTEIYFVPSTLTDLKPAIQINSAMYGGGVIEYLKVSGPHVWTLSNSDVWLSDPSQLPNYSAFSDGVCGFSVTGTSQPVFRNCSTKNVKVGLLLKSTNGHVTSYDCSWYGLFGVYCLWNTEDYFFQGGSIQGVFACMIYGCYLISNHYGGFQVNIHRVHLGFSPYGIYQVNDYTVPSGQRPSSFYGRLIDARFEQIGEAIIQTLPDAPLTNLYVNTFGMSWSVIYQGWETQPPTGWASNLPGRIKAYGDQQQYALRLGRLGANVRISEENGTSTYESPYAANPGGVLHAEVLDADTTSSRDLHGLVGRFVFGSPPGNISRLQASGNLLRRGETAYASNVRRNRNLICNPDVIGNWSSTSPAGGTVEIVTAQDIVPPTPSAFSATLPDEMIMAVGANPAVVKLTGASTGETGISIPIHGAPFDAGGLPVCLRAWVLAAAGTSPNLRVALTSGTLYSRNINDDLSRWKLIEYTGAVPANALSAGQISASAGHTVYVAGFMISLGEVTPYNPYQSPLLHGGATLLDGSATSVTSATALIPRDTAGELMIASRLDINNRSLWRVSYIKQGTGLTLNSVIGKTVVGTDPISGVGTSSGNVVISCTAGTSLKWATQHVPLPTA